MVATAVVIEVVVVVVLISKSPFQHGNEVVVNRRPRWPISRQDPGVTRSKEGSRPMQRSVSRMQLFRLDLSMAVFVVDRSNDKCGESGIGARFAPSSGPSRGDWIRRMMG